MSIPKKRSIQNIITMAIRMTFITIRRLLFSKKTIGILCLCFIPIFIFTLWSVDAFPENSEVLFEEEYASIFELDETSTDPELNVLFDPSSVEVETTVENGEEILELKIRGTGTFPYYHSIDHLSIKVYIYLSDLDPINLAELFNNSYNGYLVGPIETQNFTLRGTAANGISDWRDWELILRSPLLANPKDYIEGQLEANQPPGSGAPPDYKPPPGAENFQNLLEQADIDIQNMIRLGLYVRGFNDNITIEQNWTHAYIELYPIMDGNSVKDFGVVGVDLVERTIEEDGYKVFMENAPGLFFFFIIPLITLLYANSAVSDDIENHTIVYLITRPVTKTEILFFKFKGFFISAWIPIVISFAITFFIIAQKEGSLFIHLDYLGTFLILITLSILAYGVIFFIFSLITSYPIVLSLLYVFFLETTFWQIPNAISRFSIMYHIQCMADGMLGEIANVNIYQPLIVEHSLLTLCGVIIGFFILAIIIFKNRDFE